MREITCATIQDAVSRLCALVNMTLPEDVAAKLEQVAAEEALPLPKLMMEQIIANQEAALDQSLPLCQDTGVAVVFAELGQDAHISGGLLAEAVNAGIADGYQRYYLRKSMVDTLSRVNTGDNTPCVLHTKLVAGEGLRLTLLAKGGGAENMSALAMLKPAQGRQGIVDFVVDTVAKAGANACPPLCVGVGLGGDFEQAPLLAKSALLREIGSVNADAAAAELEAELLERINQLGIGVQGFGGPHTALAVFVESAPCHFASLPVAVNINCHSARHASVML